MYYSSNHVPSEEDHKKAWKQDIFHLKNEINRAEQFIREAKMEIARLEKLV